MDQSATEARDFSRSRVAKFAMMSREQLDADKRDDALMPLSDQLKAYLTLFLDVHDLLALAQVSRVWYIFCAEEPLWMHHVLRVHRGNFLFAHTWKQTFFHPRRGPTDLCLPPRPSISVDATAFTSDFLYRRYCRCHMLLAHFVPDDRFNAATIPRLSKQAMTHETFFQRFSTRPIILTDAMEAWPAYASTSPRRWTIEHLVAHHGSTPCRVTHNLDVTASTLQMTLSDFVAYAATQHDETPLYIFDKTFGESMPDLVADYAPPAVFQEDLLALIAPPTMRPDFRWLVIGPPRSGAPWHIDPVKTSAWNALISGRKRWAMYPPGRCPPGVPLIDDETASPGQSSLDWYLHVYPTLADADKPIEVVQEPGDVIFVPSGWWHLVLNLEFSVAVTQNFVDANNVSNFIQELMDDGEFDRLGDLETLVARHHPALTYLFQLHRMPLDMGYLNERAMVETAFSDIMTWQPRIRRVLDLHPRLMESLRAYVVQTAPWAQPLRVLTSRVNPTFSVHDRLVIKWFSPLNRLWGECNEATVLTTNFPKRDDISAKPQPTTALSLQRFYESSFEMEQLVYTALATSPFNDEEIAPTMVASGYGDRRDTTWRWPYIVTTLDPTLISLHDAVKQGAGQTWFPTFHGLVVPSRMGVLGNDMASPVWYMHYLQQLRDASFAVHAAQDLLPRHLLHQLDTFLPANMSVLVDTASPVVLVHQDLTDENILGRAVDVGPAALRTALMSLSPVDRVALEAYCQSHDIQTVAELVLVEPWTDTGVDHAVRWTLFKQAQAETAMANSFLWQHKPTESAMPFDGSLQWTPRMVIDFADTKTGDPLFDLPPVLFSMLHGDIELCATLLQSPYWATRIDCIPFAYRMMCLALCHPSQCMGALFEFFPHARELPTWDAVADAVFGSMLRYNPKASQVP
ncbi:Aste57867_23500 [Aphanomyces stellatus]|uniref:Aste57867_23500 protein n=1 Tax=Aphanomyces stellatus TaxID=120398 RepID=A0A485LMV7_9STRA|nr:hypothetical protein As57867_023429 [Aphanomyces stellatus]VFU00145.1 Aste57867_23500 [Aphanomyces stellatus]